MKTGTIGTLTVYIKSKELIDMLDEDNNEDDLGRINTDLSDTKLDTDEEDGGDNEYDENKEDDEIEIEVCPIKKKDSSK